MGHSHKQANKKAAQPLMHIRGITFAQTSRARDYILYRAQKSRTLGDIVVDIFLEQVPSKGWWGGARLNDRFRMRLSLEQSTLFPTPEIALMATEDFLANEQQVRAALQNMRQQKKDLETFCKVPPRPAKIDPKDYFSPPVLEINGSTLTLNDITRHEAVYRLWEDQQIAGMTVSLQLVHTYGEGWQAVILLHTSQIIVIQLLENQAFHTPEKALKELLTLCTEDDAIYNLAPQLKDLDPHKKIFVTHFTMSAEPAQPPLRVDGLDFEWQRQISEGHLYQEKRGRFIGLRKVHIQLVKTWGKGWLGTVHYKDISNIYFANTENVTYFSTPEEALAITRTFIAMKGESLQMLQQTDHKRRLMQCSTGEYGQWMSIRLLEVKSDQ